MDLERLIQKKYLYNSGLLLEKYTWKMTFP